MTKFSLHLESDSRTHNKLINYYNRLVICSLSRFTFSAWRDAWHCTRSLSAIRHSVSKLSHDAFVNSIKTYQAEVYGFVLFSLVLSDVRQTGKFLFSLIFVFYFLICGDLHVYNPIIHRWKLCREHLQRAIKAKIIEILPAHREQFYCRYCLSAESFLAT